MYCIIWKDFEGHKCVLSKRRVREMKETMYVTAEEAMRILKVSRGYAYRVIRELNEELEKQGYRVIRGKVPRKYFQEKFYGM